MIVPAVTSVPSNTLTPRRCALESRPLRVEPPPFVFDISASSALRALAAGGRDVGDLHDRVLLPMPVAPALIGPPLVGEPVDLGALGLADHGGRHGGALQLIRRGEDGVAVDEQDSGEADLVALGGAEQVNLDPLALDDAFLAPSGGDDGVHSEERAYPMRE